MKILNIYAVPRSGSSLVQNLVATNLKGYEANPENWLAVQLFGPLKYPTYNFTGMESARLYTNAAFSDLLEKNLIQCFDKILEETSLTKKIVEKTTRNIYYHEFISKSSHTNSNLVLIRHPFDIFLSHINYFSKGRRYYFKTWLDLTRGLDIVWDLSQTNKNLVMLYEDITNNLNIEIDRVANFLSEQKKFDNAKFIKLEKLTTILANVDSNFKESQELNSVKKYKFQTSKISLIDWIFFYILTRKGTGASNLLETHYSSNHPHWQLFKRIRYIGLVHFLQMMISFIVVTLNLKVLYKRLKSSETLWMLR
jgi:hypothetical protein